MLALPGAAFGDDTPLHRAALAGNVGDVRVLIRQGADVSARDDRGRTPLQLASDAEVKGMLRALE